MSQKQQSRLRDQVTKAALSFFNWPISSRVDFEKSIVQQSPFEWRIIENAEQLVSELSKAKHRPAGAGPVRMELAYGCREWSRV
jgi:hypothetical protein